VIERILGLIMAVAVFFGLLLLLIPAAGIVFGVVKELIV